MTEFNKEEVLNNYIEAVMEGDDAKANEVAASLPVDMAEEDRVQFIKDLIAKLKDKDQYGGLEKEIKQLEKTVEVIESLKYYAEAQENSISEDAKDESKAEEGAEDAPADTDAEAVKAEDSEAPAVEEKTEKSEQ